MSSDLRAKAQGSYLTIAHPRIRDEGAAGAAIAADVERVQTPAPIRCNLAQYLPRLLQLAGEAGNVFVRNRVH